MTTLNDFEDVEDTEIRLGDWVRVRSGELHNRIGEVRQMTGSIDDPTIYLIVQLGDDNTYTTTLNNVELIQRDGEHCPECGNRLWYVMDQDIFEVLVCGDCGQEVYISWLEAR